MTIFLALLRRYWLHVAVLAVLSYGIGCYTEWVYTSGYNAANVRAEKVIGDFAKAEADAQAKARKAEQESAAKQAAIAEQYEQDQINAQIAADRLVADLRAGNVRLRSEWAGCATDRVSQIGTSAAELDAAAAVRERLAAEIVRVGAEADAQVRGLQRVIESDRGQ